MNKKNLVLGLLLVAAIGGTGGTFWWSQETLKKANAEHDKKLSDINGQLQTATSELNDLKTQLTEVRTQKEELEKKHCLGVWKDGACKLRTCVDSDGTETNSGFIFIPGTVTYSDDNGEPATLNDECTQNRKQVIELYCIESPERSGNLVYDKKIYDCPSKKCVEGACVRKKAKG